MAAKKKTPAPKPKKTASKRSPPMHRAIRHAELDDANAEHSETFEIFKSFDRDGSGSIDRTELSRLLEALDQPLEEEDLEIALSVIDSNGSGRVSWHEFKAWWSAR